MNKEVEKMMKLLGLSEEEAKQLIEDDKAVDKMSVKELESDLTPEQKANAKKSRQADRKKESKGKTVYKFDTSKRKKVENVGKKKLIELMTSILAENGATDFEVANPEREFAFLADGVKYKVVMSVPRK